LYLVVARRSEDGSFGNAQDGALYRSRDGAEHWEKVALPRGVNGPNGLIDLQDPNRLYLAAWGRNEPDGAVNGGIFLSADGVASWRNVLSQDPACLRRVGSSGRYSSTLSLSMKSKIQNIWGVKSDLTCRESL
jgi:hypothetical protein